MPRDPVCGRYVDEDTPFQSDLDVQTRYFCSRECLEEFEYEFDEDEFAEPTKREAKEED